MERRGGEKRGEERRERRRKERGWEESKEEKNRGEKKRREGIQNTNAKMVHKTYLQVHRHSQTLSQTEKQKQRQTQAGDTFRKSDPGTYRNPQVIRDRRPKSL